MLVMVAFMSDSPSRQGPHVLSLGDASILSLQGGRGIRLCVSTINLANGSLTGCGNWMLSILKPADGMAPFGMNQLAQAHDTNWGKNQVCSVVTLWRMLVLACCSEPATRDVKARDAWPCLAEGHSGPCGGWGDPDACPWAPPGLWEGGQRVPGLCLGADVLEVAVHVFVHGGSCL